MDKKELENLLRLISANITENRIINEEIIRLLKLTTVPQAEFETINKLMSTNKAIHKLLVDSIPT